MNSQRRVGIMGSAGSGKTTFARYLCAALGVSLIEEGVREWLAHRGFKEPKTLPWDIQLELQEHYLTAKMRKEAIHQAFVSDRTTIDAVVNLLLRRLPGDSARAKLPNGFARRALTYAGETYDLIVLLRWNGEPRPVPDGIREVDPVKLQLEHDLCVALCELAGLRMVFVDAHPDPNEIDRVIAALCED